MKKYQILTETKVVIKKLHYPVDRVYFYDAQILRSFDGGKSFYHCGEGQFCKTYKEAKNFKEKYEKKFRGVK